jgi:hypothetical protein
MLSDEQTEILSAIQKAVVRLVATSPAGHGLILIGGFRYRFLDRSVRMSRDVDYHWDGELEGKQQELVRLFRKRLLPALRRQYGFGGSASPASGPDAESPDVRTVVVAVWKEGEPYSRVEIPVDVTRVRRADRVEVRTVDGVVYPTLSDADMVESKIVALFRRNPMQHRDLIDVFLFGNKLPADSPRRLAKKFKNTGVTVAAIRQRIEDLDRHVTYHAKAIQAIVDTQFDPEAAGHINAAGGGAMVLRTVAATLRKCVGAA